MSATYNATTRKLTASVSPVFEQSDATQHRKVFFRVENEIYYAKIKNYVSETIVELSEKSYLPNSNVTIDDVFLIDYGTSNADNKEQQISDAIQTLLEAGDFATHFENVFVHPQRPIAANELPAIVFRDNSFNNIDAASDTDIINTDFDIEGIFAEGETTIETARAGLADIEFALGEDETLGGLVSGIIIDGREIIKTDEEQQRIGGFKLSGKIVWQKTRFNKT